jgi:hypothetical protein
LIARNLRGVRLPTEPSINGQMSEQPDAVPA